MKIVNCGRCVFAKRAGIEGAVLECWRHPPHLQIVTRQAVEGSDEPAFRVQYGRPAVSPVDFCGDGAELALDGAAGA